jgi:uncharacterized membrane protein
MVTTEQRGRSERPSSAWRGMLVQRHTFRTDRHARDLMADRSDSARTLARWVLGGALILAGTGHRTTQRDEFQAQVPDWFPVDDDLVVVASGVVELSLGAALILARRRRQAVGLVVAGFFVVIFPGNIGQWLEGTDAFGLDSDTARFDRLLFQPVLVAWALWCSGAWRAWRSGTWPHPVGEPTGVRGSPPSARLQ